MRIRFLRCFLHFLVVFASSTCLLSQNQRPVSDPQAVRLAQQAIAMLAQGVALQDVTLTGTVTRSLGSSAESGTVTLSALGSGESRMDLFLPSGTRAEIRDGSSGAPRGKWISPDGTSGPLASHNCWTDAAWFFPVLGSLAAGPNIVLSYIGQESRNRAKVYHIQSHVYQPDQTAPVGPEQWSTIDFYLDSATLLPVSMVFKTHADDDVNVDIPIEIRFDNYQSMGGVLVPSNIQQIGSVTLDVVVTSAAFNSGLSNCLFSVE